MHHHRGLPLWLLALVLFLACAPAGPRVPGPAATDRLHTLDADARRWVDSALASLDTRGRAAQLVFPWMWGRYVPADSEEGRLLRSWVEAGVGGILTSIGPPVVLADKLNRLQGQAALPLLVAADLENGPGQRLQGGTLLPYGVDMGGGTVFPPAMGLAAAGDPELVYEMGRVTAAEARAVGIHLTFAPVVDVNNNPANPIINTRSYGSDPARVSELAVAQVRGLQDHGLLATAKHFPGHGDTETDTHLAPYILTVDAARADSVELVPYRAVIAAGVAGIMSAHIAFPALSGDSLPATLSSRMLDSLLVRELGFGGLVVTDALNMGAIVQVFGPGDAAVRALEAGADLLLQPADPLVVIDAVTRAVEEGRIVPERLERSVRKILEAKTRVGLHRGRVVDVSRVAEVVASPEHQAVARDAARSSITLVHDRGGLVPLVPLRDRQVLLVSYTDAVSPFAGRALARALAPELVNLRHVALGPDAPPAAVMDSIVARADSADLVIVAVDARVRAGAGPGAVEPRVADAIRRMARRPLVLVSLGNPYLAEAVPDAGSYLLGWSGSEASQMAVAEALLGRAPIAGTLPIGIGDVDRGGGLARGTVRPGLAAPVSYSSEPRPPAGPDGARDGVEPLRGRGSDTTSVPVAASAPLDGWALDSLSAAVEAAIADGVTPGAVVAVGTSRGGAWIQAFGHTDWAETEPVVTYATLYDVASLTKVVGTTSAVMALVDDGRMALDAPLSRYLPAWPEGGWRDEVTIRALLTHTAGLPGFVPFWQPDRGLRGDSAVVAAIAALDPAYPPGTDAVYSDPGFILLGAAVEALAGVPLNAYLADRVFEPLEMTSTGFNPRGLPVLSGGLVPVPGDTAGNGDPEPETDPGTIGDTMVAAVWAPLEGIAPTEVDAIFRHRHVHGEVHDENAWIMGGVAGHAGLFTTAPDLSRFAHALLRGGRGEDRVFNPERVAAFTARQPRTDRALGWDVRGVPNQETGDDPGAGTIAGPFAPGAFGHTGFTGTSLWVDPSRDLYVVLLTNRVNPTRAQGGIGGLRRAVHRWAVEAVP